MTANEIGTLIRINETHVNRINRIDDIGERTIRLNMLNSVMNDIIDLIIERSEDDTK